VQKQDGDVQPGVGPVLDEATACSTWLPARHQAHHRAAAAQRQNLLFSHFPDEIRIWRIVLSNRRVQVATRNAAADLVTHVVHPVAREKSATCFPI